MNEIILLVDSGSQIGLKIELQIFLRDTPKESNI